MFCKEILGGEMDNYYTIKISLHFHENDDSVSDNYVLLCLEGCSRWESGCSERTSVTLSE